MPDSLILITGASSDIGVALIQHLLTQDATVRVLAHSFRGGERIEALVAQFGERVVSLTADFTDAASVTVLADRIAADFGTPTALVHLPAPRLLYERFTKLKWPAMQVDFAVQIESAVILLQRFLPKMAKLPGSRVVFVLSSVVHGVPPKFMVQYTIAKYAQLGLMRALAAEYAATSVRVNAISPSMIDTQFLGELPAVAVEMTASSNPLGRNAKPDDLLGALGLLLGPASDYMNGVDIPITAGTAI